MLTVSGTNIISSLGFSTSENFDNIIAGKSGLKRYGAEFFDLSEPFVASLIDRERLNVEFAACCDVMRSAGTAITDLEKAAILSVYYANREAKVDLASAKTVFVISTTKGNVDLLRDVCTMCELPVQAYLWHSAKIISEFFGNPNTPVAVSNACISGGAAQIAAMRQLESNDFDFAVVVGVDFLSQFIISGFQSFKALSQDVCRPFDSLRDGLNLGEAAATMIFSRPHSAFAKYGLLYGAIRNDANHISAPSRTGEGSFRALNAVINHQASFNKAEIAFINAHGTATPYNDSMEMIAIERAGLQKVPTNSLKQYLGHTLGAAGVVESIISLKALEQGVVLPMLNVKNLSETCKINISQKLQTTDKQYFIKMLSGFGGVNVALLFGKAPQNITQKKKQSNPLSCSESFFIKKQINLAFNNSSEITDLYRSLSVDYPKFFKMDNLSKMGFVASEMIFEGEKQRFVPREDFAVIGFNRSSSLDVDVQYQNTIRKGEHYFPSPSLFVYTLPNIVAGEIAIRNNFFGETAFYVFQTFDTEQIKRILNSAFADKRINEALAVWVEAFEIKMQWLVVNELRNEGMKYS
ncbi:MAG: 3-oxoacyl-ACP synthase [Prevotellaceae bacterium]|nr:3-oxoacyl-ACP synthase [Prevotellaceae bacterium]